MQNEKQLWELIEKANWKADHNYKRIQEEFKQLPTEQLTELKAFARQKQGQLMKKFREVWLGDDELEYEGLPVSDDGWNDLTADIVGRGQAFYESVTPGKLKKMAENDDFEENFLYSFHL